MQKCFVIKSFHLVFYLIHFGGCKTFTEENAVFSDTVQTARVKYLLLLLLFLKEKKKSM